MPPAALQPPESSRALSRLAIYPALLIAVWVAMTAAINPSGEFPLNDDWAYAWTVQQFVATGSLIVSDWAGATVVTQSIWGALLVSVFGFSFTMLRVSSIVLGCAGTFAVFGILRVAGATRLVAFFGALSIAVNPLYVTGAFSFNTDVPSFAISALSVFYFARGLRGGSTWAIAAGTLLSVASVLNRQSGIVVPAAFGLALLVSRGGSLRTAAAAAAPTATALTVHALCTFWLSSTGGLPWLSGYHLDKLIVTFSQGATHATTVYADNLVRMGAYVGLFLFPFVLAPVACEWRRHRARAAAIMASGVAVGILLLGSHGPMPYAGNVLAPFGAGPITLVGYDALLGDRHLQTVRLAWTTLTIIGAASAVWTGALLSGAVLAAARSTKTAGIRRDVTLLFFAGSAIAYFLVIGGLDTAAWFDRYLLFPVPMLMAAIVVAVDRPELRMGRATAAVSGVALALTAAFTTAAVHDYLSWNRARWIGADRLMRQGIPPSAIEGGFEFRGWFSGNEIETCNPSVLARARDLPPEWDDFTCVFGGPEDSRPYLLAFVRADGYSIVDTVAFDRWLPRRRQQLLVMRRPDWFQR